METTYAGIDYGMGKSNIDQETGIRYGVISQNELLQAWADSSEPNYPWACGYCGEDLPGEPWEYPVRCKYCDKDLDENDFDMQEPAGFTYNKDGYVCQQSNDDMDIFILKSPYFTYCQFASPCAPGAGYLMNFYKPTGKAKEQLTLVNIIAPLAAGEAYRSHAEKNMFPKAYCFGHDWFEAEKAPYPVFSIETGELVNP